ncbi:Transketolase, thiamine diphosphate binding domain protein [Selenomonas sp. oral taxon 138 str. F0429]|nr:Transketolase, thiamine diphosphate binding domain protein [Selenomonas sp. oral taxon 138 str. F0429]
MRKEEKMELEELKEAARRIRRATIQSIHAVGTGHAGGALSIADLLAVLYFDEMRVRPADPNWAERDRFVLSKGHACASLYAALAERGYFPAEELLTLRQYGSRLQGHPDMKVTPGLDMSSGSLGQGLSIGNGMALAAKLRRMDYRVYVLLGDGELEEGQIWEAAMTARRYALDNIVAIVDANGLQINGAVEEVAGLSDIGTRFAAFGWHVIDIDGHDLAAIRAAFAAARETAGVPTVIVAHTVKGKGISYMENQVKWHSGVPSEDEYRTALQELGGEA